MGKQYFYGKIVSVFGNMMSGKGGGINNIFKYMMLSEMMKSGSSAVGGTGGNNMLPMFMMMNGGEMFDGMFDFADGEDDESEEEE